MKSLSFILIFTFISLFSYSQEFKFDFIPNSLDETILENEKYIKPHFLGNTIARKVKLIELAYKWEDPPTATRLTPLIQIEKQPIYFAVKKILSPKFYKSKIRNKEISKEDAIKQLSEILDIAIMIRYQETEAFENAVRNINAESVLDIFKNQIKLLYF
jgi:hypothetical protein|tara:strand:- start:687 stop:1163 length:477 start_codon:yes stop_codon:yes gene_type:complete